MGDAWKRGLLGAALGATNVIVNEYENINKEKRDIRDEQRAEQRAIAAEKRREEAERRAEIRRKQLNIDYVGIEDRAKAESQVGLINEGLDPTLARAKKTDEYNVAQAEQGLLPSQVAEEFSNRRDIERAETGRHAPTTVKEIADLREANRIKEGGGLTVAKGELATKEQKERDENQALVDIRKKLAQKELGVDSTNVSITTSEAQQLLKASFMSQVPILETLNSDLKAGMPNVKRELATGKLSIEEVLNDTDNYDMYRAQLIRDFQLKGEKELANAGARKQIDSTDVIDAMVEESISRVDNTLEHLRESVGTIRDPAFQQTIEGTMRATGSSREDAIKLLIEKKLDRARLASAWGEPPEASKQSAGFRQQWNIWQDSVSQFIK